MAYLGAFGKYLPSRVVDNNELATMLGVSPEWIESSSGIQERRFAAEDESVVSMAERAAEDCLRAAGLSSTQLGMIVMSCGSPERQFPGPGVQVACRLGVPGIPVIDLCMPSAGALFAIVLAAKSLTQGPVLVVAAERMSSVVLREPVDKNTAILFGDGAGACVVSETAGFAEIRDSLICSDGTFAEDLRLEFGRPLEMNGPSVIMQASRKIPRVITDLLTKNSLTPADIDMFLLHQANQNLLDRVTRSLKVEEKKAFSNIRKYGNTSSASLLIAATEWQAAEGFRPGVPVVMATFGAGFHWGALLATGA